MSEIDSKSHPRSEIVIITNTRNRLHLYLVEAREDGNYGALHLVQLLSYDNRSRKDLAFERGILLIGKSTNESLDRLTADEEVRTKFFRNSGTIIDKGHLGQFTSIKGGEPLLFVVDEVEVL